ncbi:multiple coagulation factor deficiency protein 2 homolog [Tribolium madens]|uniref:multiple coagulation factor deficiency protein 2 homolog n=1 Tax=Tribolium madens TaxID=41895 RepID=UPI001CF72209|nr:multiple coagulation factor deficiency protein 2 homolog [Tribolium madens]XP_044256260.1 multiple coagulation factor deficiency protein 2 homolog [Tribolium madens]
MFVFLACFSIFQSVLLISVQAQRAPPGVPPQHYQGGSQQQYQHVPVQHQQVPMQHQQVPVQHQQVPMQHVPMQQQVPMQQVPQQVPVQHHHGQPQQILNAANIAHEKEHIAEHMEVPIDTSKMSEQELQFHYFKMHDADNNNKLDGCELIKSLIHWHEQGSKEKAGQIEDKIFKDEELVTLIDPILNVDDSNRDGYIDYPEFVRAQQKAAGQGKPTS